MPSSALETESRPAGGVEIPGTPFIRLGPFGPEVVALPETTHTPLRTGRAHEVSVDTRVVGDRVRDVPTLPGGLRPPVPVVGAGRRQAVVSPYVETTRRTSRVLRLAPRPRPADAVAARPAPTRTTPLHALLVAPPRNIRVPILGDRLPTAVGTVVLAPSKGAAPRQTDAVRVGVTGGTGGLVDPAVVVIVLAFHTRPARGVTGVDADGPDGLDEGTDIGGGQVPSPRRPVRRPAIRVGHQDVGGLPRIGATQPTSVEMVEGTGNTVRRPMFLNSKKYEKGTFSLVFANITQIDLKLSSETGYVKD